MSRSWALYWSGEREGQVASTMTQIAGVSTTYDIHSSRLLNLVVFSSPLSASYRCSPARQTPVPRRFPPETYSLLAFTTTLDFPFADVGLACSRDVCRKTTLTTYLVALLLLSNILRQLQCDTCSSPTATSVMMRRRCAVTFPQLIRAICLDCCRSVLNQVAVRCCPSYPET